MGSERRRAARINARMWVRLEGVDTDWRLRRTNMSVSGVFIELDRGVGEPGSVQRLSLRSQSLEHEVHLLVRVIRVIASSDLWHGTKVAGAAFEFMPDSQDMREKVEALTRHLLSLKPESLPTPLAPQGAAQVNMPATLDGAKATLKALSISGMMLETSWEAQPGEVIRCEIQAPGSQRTFRLEGEVVDAVQDVDASGSTGYHVQVQFHDKHGRVAAPARRAAEGLSINDAIDALLEEAVFTPRETGFVIPNEHLGGLLSRIRLPSLLGFVEIERLTGVCTLLQGADVVHLYLLAGQLIDVDSPQKPSADPLAVLGPCMNWTEGKFEFALSDVTRPPRIHMSTTHLLLKLTTEYEEQKR